MVMTRIYIILLFEFIFVMILLTMPSFGFLSSVRIRKERASSLAFISKEKEDQFFAEIEKIITEKVAYYFNEFEALMNQTINNQFDKYEASSELLLNKINEICKLRGISITEEDEDESDSLDGKLIGYLHSCPQC